MSFLHNLKLWITPLRIADPEFGTLVFINISKRPNLCYWEGKWVFPATGSVVGITLPGGESGPEPGAREFYLGLPAWFDSILILCRPGLEQIFRDWRKGHVPQDVFTAVKVSYFGLEDPCEQPIRWEVGFETTDRDWLAITIPFVGDTPKDPLVDT